MCFGWKKPNNSNTVGLEKLQFHIPALNGRFDSLSLTCYCEHCGGAHTHKLKTLDKTSGSSKAFLMTATHHLISEEVLKSLTKKKGKEKLKNPGRGYWTGKAGSIGSRKLVKLMKVVLLCRRLLLDVPQCCSFFLFLIKR